MNREETKKTVETVPKNWEPDEHQIYLNLMQAHDEAFIKREHYKRFGPTFVILSGLAFLALIFSLDSKIEFLVLWVITDIFALVKMIQAEYRLHKFRSILGLPDIDAEEEEIQKEVEV